MIQTHSRRAKAHHLVFKAFIATIYILHSIDLSQASPSKQQDIQDPLVWDSNSLYKSLKIPNPYPLPKQRLQKRSVQPATSVNQLSDVCPSRLEVISPYYATNSRGQLRTIVNSELIQQAIQVETCIRSANQANSKCNAQSDCGCEQKYKWHRLLCLDPRHPGPSRDLHMDWFLFPSNCVCRCKMDTGKQFLKLVNKQ